MPRFRFATAAFLIVLLAVRVTVLGQTNIPRAEPMRPGGLGVQPGGYYPPSDRLEVVDPDKRLAAGDEVTFEIEQDRDGAVSKVVTATGEIEVYPAGRVKVAGKTTAEAAAEIKRVLEKDYYYHATVRLSLDRASRTVVKAGQILLSGEVRGPGPLDLVSGERLSVSQAILKSGGFREFADDRRVQVTRIEGGSTKKIIVDVKEILRTGNLEKDIPLQDGDRVYVPRVFGKI
jgi:protein involved in polysaccharide export with SLBB domain